MPMTEEEKREALLLAESLGAMQIAETLEDLVAREKALLEAPMDDDIRAITLHNISVLTAACAGYQELAKKHQELMDQAEQRHLEALAEAEQRRQDGELDRVDSSPGVVPDDDVP